MSIKMKRAFRTLTAAIATALALSASAAGATTLVGYFDGNDPFGTGQGGGLYGTYNGRTINSPSLAKCDAVDGGAGGCSWENGSVPNEDYTKAFQLSFDKGGKSGIWSFTDATSGKALTHSPAYMAVKGANTWALYALDGAFFGEWSTGGILNGGGKQPGVSHVSFYNSVAPVPLPAAVWMLLAGLGSLGVVARRRRSA
jgi:PEP-CTERM motif